MPYKADLTARIFAAFGHIPITRVPKSRVDVSLSTEDSGAILDENTI
jgi:hypothetical protein